MQTQGLPGDKCLRAHPQPLGLPMPGPGESCHDHYAECRLMPGGGPADHPASHWGEASDAGAHQVGHAQEECAPLEERGRPAMRQHSWALRPTSPASCVYSVLGCPRLPAPPVRPGERRSPLAGVTAPQGCFQELSESVVLIAMLLVDGKSMGEITVTAGCQSKSSPSTQ